MGKLIKLLMLVVSACVLIFIIVGVIKGVSNIANESKIPQHSASTLPGKKEYDKVRVGEPMTGKGGMTLKEVEKLLGKSTSETVGQTGNQEMIIYTFAANAGPNSIMVTFINGHASGKSQTGL
ncbi:hypothetical protein HPT25_19505 [Bacillus sp. BRMEA1]|uniref:hypothetical protein n=1 Tax=Neobacillus endophyticus TaxID=2738405 RepID=UPI00156789EC|nr:hypothetical protein [Neobacillus endophyticus]NRD79551.1 hypothetical protein [Neobacillus endophyticus]